MKLKQSYEILQELNPLKIIELAGRVCYKSEDKITEDSYKKFVPMLVERNHLAMVEHGILYFTCNTVNNGISKLVEYTPYAKITQDNFGNLLVSINSRAFIEVCEQLLPYDDFIDEPDYVNLLNCLLFMIGEVYWKYPELVSNLYSNYILSISIASEKLKADKILITLETSFDLTDDFDVLSKFEHTYYTIKITSDRGITHEAVRHRLPSFAQESTRYVNYAKSDEITYIDIAPGLEYDPKCKVMSIHLKNEVLAEWERAMKDAEAHYMRLMQLGVTPQIARSVLPTSTKTEIVITTNLLEWIHIFYLRCAETAHPQMREIMIPIMKEIMSNYLDMNERVRDLPLHVNEELDEVFKLVSTL